MPRLITSLLSRFHVSNTNIPRSYKADIARHWHQQQQGHQRAGATNNGGGRRNNNNNNNNVTLDMELHNAGRNGNLVIVQDVVRRKPWLIGCRDNQGNLPLHLAVQYGHREVSEYLVREYPQGSYALNQAGISPLHLALNLRQSDLVRYIVNRIHNHAHGFETDLMAHMRSILTHAIRDDNQEMLRIMLQHRPPVFGMLDEQGRTPLTYAAHLGRVAIVEFLIQSYPRSIRMADRYGQTILHVIANQRNEGLNNLISDLLNRSESLLRMQDENERTALQLATESGNHYAAEIIRQRMAPPPRRR